MRVDGELALEDSPPSPRVRPAIKRRLDGELAHEGSPTSPRVRFRQLSDASQKGFELARKRALRDGKVLFEDIREVASAPGFEDATVEKRKRVARFCGISGLSLAAVLFGCFIFVAFAVQNVGIWSYSRRTAASKVQTLQEQLIDLAYHWQVCLVASRTTGEAMPDAESVSGGQPRSDLCAIEGVWSCARAHRPSPARVQVGLSLYDSWRAVAFAGHLPAEDPSGPRRKQGLSVQLRDVRSGRFVRVLTSSEFEVPINLPAFNLPAPIPVDPLPCARVLPRVCPAS